MTVTRAHVLRQGSACARGGGGGTNQFQHVLDILSALTNVQLKLKAVQGSAAVNGAAKCLMTRENGVESRRAATKATRIQVPMDVSQGWCLALTK